MALFGVKDKDLPLLTQFYQLEFDQAQIVGSELDEWEWRQTGRPASAWSTEGGQDRQQQLQPLADLYPLIYRMMTDFADRQDVETSDIAALNRKLEERLRPFVSYDPRGQTNTGRILVSALELAYGDRYAGLDTALLSSFLTVLSDDDKENAFRRCEECHNVFVAGRGSQIRCSKRCNDRVSARRVRGRRKSESDNDVGSINTDVMV